MSGNHPSIDLSEIYAELDNELDDLYTDGIISAAIYGKKNTKRLLLHAISSADRHICLRLKLSANVAVFVPSGQRTIFFRRQNEFIADFVDEHSAVTDGYQLALLIGEEQYLDVISVLSNYAHAYSTLPVSEEESPTDVLYNSLASDVENRPSRKFSVTGGRVVTQRPSGKRFYVEPNSRKMVLSGPFSADTWLKFKAQIAPVETKITGLTEAALDEYEIRTPYYGRRWLVYRAMTTLLPGRAASEAGYFELESRSELETLDNRPGTGNVVIGGDELTDSYEGNLDNF